MLSMKSFLKKLTLFFIFAEPKNSALHVKYRFLSKANPTENTGAKF
jgi:hypothetical protein